MTDVFDLSFVDHDDKRANDFRELDAAIEQLAARRLARLEIEGPFLQSKLAWKIASYQQAILYRTVALARGARVAWNTRNALSSYLLVRALVETIAVFDDFESVLIAAFVREDIGEMDELVMNRMFATRDDEMVRNHPELLAVTVLKFIDKMGKRYDLPIRDNYDRLSERCHPNSAGHHQMFAVTNRTNGTVVFTEAKNLQADLDIIRAPLFLLHLFERGMDKVDETIPAVAALHHRIRPLRSR